MKVALLWIACFKISAWQFTLPHVSTSKHYTVNPNNDWDYDESWQCYFLSATGFGTDFIDDDTVANRKLLPMDTMSGTYGEILPSCIRILISQMDLNDKDVLFDLGSGH
jgi:hypothetical protein